MDAMNDNHDTVLLIGGGGKTGRRVAARLTAAGVPNSLASRSSEVTFDWNDSSTWDAAFDGVTKAYVTYYPDLAFPGATDAIEALRRLAVEREVAHLVLLSGRGEPAAQRCEQILLTSGVPTTVVRCSWFAQNFSEDFLTDFVREGTIALPAGDVAEPFVDADDIADVVVAALTQPGHAGRVYELTGPQALTFAEVAAELSTVTGRGIDYVSVTVDEFAAEAIAGGLPAEEVEPLAELFTSILDGRNSAVQYGVQEALGRPARSFSDYAATVAASGAWTLDGGVAGSSTEVA